MYDIFYVGTINGRLIVVILKGLEFFILWLFEFEVLIFGFFFISFEGNVICGLVSGDVFFVNSRGFIVWRVKINGLIFVGSCLFKVFCF